MNLDLAQRDDDLGCPGYICSSVYTVPHLHALAYCLNAVQRSFIGLPLAAPSARRFRVRQRVWVGHNSLILIYKT